jgi:hypothetical protein
MRRAGASLATESLQNPSACVGPVRNGFAAPVRRLDATIQLREPSLLPVRIARTVHTRDDFRRELEALVFLQREYVLQEPANGPMSLGRSCFNSSSPSHPV